MIARELVPLPAYTGEVVRGLTARSKVLPCKLFYDDRGSELFEQITRLPEYYLTRSEFQILEESSGEIARTLAAPISVVELGAGTAAKTGTLLRAFAGRQIRLKYFPVDISPAALNQAKERILEQSANISVRPIIADFSDGFDFLRGIAGRKLVLYLGSSIGNFEWRDAVAMLGRVRDRLAAGDSLLLGTDMAKSAAILLPAYDDSRGVTAEFNKNILARLNREFDADFDLNLFRHVAEWNPQASRVEIYLESVRDHKVDLRLARVAIHFRRGERIHTENSHKYTLEMVERLLCASGFRLSKTWFDKREWFGLHLATTSQAAGAR
jgi:L-histidine N-alpha-methyltransferase